MSQLRMRDQVGTMVDRINPLKERTHWGVVVAEGVALLILGLFILLQRQQAGAGLVQLVGGYLFVTSAIAVYRLLAGTGEPASSPGRWIRVGIGLIAGLVGFGYPWMGTIDVAAAATVLSLGLIFVGIIGLYAAIATSQITGWRWDQVLIYVIYLLLGGMVLYRNFSGSQFWLLPVLGWLATLGGLTLGGFGVWLYRRRSTQLAAAAAEAANGDMADASATDMTDGAPNSTSDAASKPPAPASISSTPPAASPSAPTPEAADDAANSPPPASKA